MTAAVLSIGTELTRGELINSNAAWLGEELTALGFEVRDHLTIDDDIDRIVEALKLPEPKAQHHRVHGGLGPTTDDLTTEAVAKALGVALVRDQASHERIAKFFASIGRTMAPSNAKQADFPEGASVLAQRAGHRAGVLRCAIGNAQLFVMPGVPREMKHIYSERILPRIAGLAERHQPPDPPAHVRLARVAARRCAQGRGGPVPRPHHRLPRKLPRDRSEAAGSRRERAARRKRWSRACARRGDAPAGRSRVR